MKTFKTYYKSPLGMMQIVGTEDSILMVKFMESKLSADPEIPACVRDCVRQIDEYFRGKRTKFSLSLFMRGTFFQKTVWKELEKIPYGRTASYEEIAVAIGKPKACRAVGGANGRNPISIIVPCHRVIGSDGTLTGYGGGLWRKEWLLKHESKNG